MLYRTSQQGVYSLVRSGLMTNQSTLALAQQQVATGRRILNASDDAAGTSILLGFNRQIGSVDRYIGALEQSRPSVDTATSKLEEAVELISSARELLIQGMNGTLSDDDRKSVAIQIELIRERLLEVGNTKFNSRYLFAGTESQTKPFESSTVGGIERVSYQGNQETLKVLAGQELEFPISITGEQVFDAGMPTGTTLVGSTGLTKGTTADGGTGYEYLQIRNDGVTGTLGAGLAFAASGHTILQDRALTVDAAAGTVQLGGGTPVAIPDPSDPGAANFTVVDESGAELRLDFSAYAGADFSGTVTGLGAISMDGMNFQSVDFSETDLLVQGESGNAIHVNTTGLYQAGQELATFTGTVNPFDVLQGVFEDLQNDDGLEVPDVAARLEARLAELDRVQDDILAGVSTLGARSERLVDTIEKHQDLRLNLTGLASNVGDVDITDAVLDLQRADQALQLAQSTGARLIQNTLLNYL